MRLGLGPVPVFHRSTHRSTRVCRSSGTSTHAKPKRSTARTRHARNFVNQLEFDPTILSDAIPV